MSNVPGQPDALLVKAEEDVSLSRNYDVTYKVQCLVRHAWCTSASARATLGGCSAIGNRRSLVSLMAHFVPALTNERAFVPHL